MEKIDSIAQKLYEHGIEKAEDRAGEIIAEAEKKAADLLREAEQKARQIRQEAEKEADQTRQNVRGELQLAGNRALAALREEITGTLQKHIFPAEIKQLGQDPSFLKELILAVAAGEGPGQDWQLELPAGLEQKIDGAFRREIADKLDQAEIRFAESLSGGFRLKRAGQDFLLDYTENALATFFNSFLREKTTRVVFQD